jgi:hypothetical protein
MKTNIELAREAGEQLTIFAAKFPEMFDRYTAAVEARMMAKLLEGAGEPVAWLYTLRYGQEIVNTRVSDYQLNYPFGVCGADYLPKNHEGVSYVKQTPLHTPDKIAAAVLHREQENLKSYLKLAEVNKQQAAIIRDLREEITAWRNRGTK